MRSAVDVSLGGVRVYSDESHRVGQQLGMELLLPDGTCVTFTAQVMWVETLPKGSPARYDVGLQFVNLADDVRSRIVSVLDPLDG